MQRKLLLVCFVAAVGCKTQKVEAPAAPPPGSAPTAGKSPVVASFAGHQITTAELQKYVDEQSQFVRSHYQDEKGKTAILQILIETQLLADQAAKDGYDHDDEVIEQLRKAMVTAWSHKTFNEAAGERSLSDADLHAFYDSHRGQYQRPERARVQMIYFKVDPGHEAAVEAEAEAARQTLSQSKDETAFVQLVRKRSDDPMSRAKDGDLDFRSHAELAKPYGETLATAVDALKGPRELSPVVHGPGGLYLLQLQARTPGEERSFESVEPELRAKLWDERRGPVRKAAIDKLMEQADIKIDDDQLAQVNSGAPFEQVPQPGAQTPPSVEEQLRTTLPPFRETAADRAGPAVATFGGHRVTTYELKHYFEMEGPNFRANYQTEKAKEVLLRGMIENQVLVDAALDGGYQNDQVAQHQYKRSMIDEWMDEKVFKEAEGKKSFADADLRAYYDAHRQDFRQPERVRVRVVLFKAAPGEEKTAQSEAEQARKAVTASRDRNAFAHLAETRSDDAASKGRGGDLDFQTREALAKSYGEALATTVASLVFSGDVSRPVIGTGGVYLVQLETRAPALDRTFEASQEALRNRLWSDQKNQKVAAYLDTLMTQAQIKIDETQLAAVKVNPGTAVDELPETVRPAGAFGIEKLNTPLAEFHEFPYTKANLNP